MTREEFKILDVEEKLEFLADKLYFDKLNNQTLADNFKTDRITPVQSKIKTPAGFELIFGTEPDKSNSSQRAVWLNQLKNFGGLISGFQARMDFPTKAEKSQSAGYDLGYPIGYWYNDEERVTFSKKPEFWRNIDWYNNYFQIFIDAARNSL